MAPPRDLRICFIGDSYVAGVGDPDFLGWIGRLCRLSSSPSLKMTAYPLGVRRQTSEQIRARWADEVAERLGSVPAGVEPGVVFSFGIKDTTLENGAARVNPERSVTNLRSILRRAKQTYPVLMIGPAPILETSQNRRIAELSVGFASACAALDVPYLDLFSPLHASSAWAADLKKVDRIHPGAKGYAMIATLIARLPTWPAFLKSR
jgi:lysophospholipase L1-like esterase